MNVIVYLIVAFLILLTGPSCLAQNNDGGCDLSDGRRISNGEKVSRSPCSTCICEGGTVVCDYVSCELPPCGDFRREPGQCCLTCPNGPKCSYEGQVLPVGDTIIVSEDESCTCYMEESGFPRLVCAIA